MTKKLLAAVMTISMLLSFWVTPTYAATFSSENWAQYERGLYTNTDKFTKCKEVYQDTSYDTEQLISVRMVANNKTVTASRNPIAYKFGENLSSYGTHSGDNATYAHMRVYVATFSDQWRNCFNNYTMRIDKDGTGSSRDFAVIETYTPSGASSMVTKTYAKNYNTSGAYMSKTSITGHQGRLGVGPDGNDTADSTTRTLPDSAYDKFDIISEFNKQSGTTTYLFVNGEFACCYYDSGLNVNRHFHGIVFRTVNTSARVNSDYIAVKFDTDRIGHREYYNTAGYTVTFEDVLQDAGLGETAGGTEVIFKTSDIQNFMPGDEKVPYIYPKDASARERINENITYSGNAAQIAASNTSSDYSIAARMLAGMYPLIGKHGVAYEDYHPKAKYIKFSFDQTISASGMWLEYATYYSGKVQALQMWNNDGKLVVGIKGGSNVTCNGSGKKPLATTTGTNHIDWVLEPDEANECMRQYVFINNVYAGEGSFGNQYVVRLNDVVLSTKNASGTVTIDNWSMTVYNDYAEFEDTGLEAPGVLEYKYKNLKVLFNEDFEGKTASTLSTTYPRTKRISDNVCLSYWGYWDNAVASGYNSSVGIYACAGVVSTNSRTFEAYLPADLRPHRGLANIKFNIKPQASLSKQDVSIFRTDSYSSIDGGNNGVSLFGNSDISGYIGTWLEVSIWVDLDNDAYQYTIYNTQSGKLVKQGSGTQKFNDLGGFVIKLKGTESGKDYAAVAPIIDNIYFASADIPDDDAFTLQTFSIDGTTGSINLDVGNNISESADVFLALYSSDMQSLKGAEKQSVTFDKKTKTATVSLDGVDVANGDIHRIFVWHKDTISPIYHSIDSRIKAYPNEIPNNFDVHTPVMRDFLADSNNNCDTYADGTIAAEEPVPVTFSWSGEEGYSYRLKVSEKSNMSSPWTFDTNDCYCDVYNLKIGTRYYWTVSAVKNSSVKYTSDVQTFTTLNVAPRTLLIGGSIRNARDIGGWSTTNGKKVKQGMVFRSSALDTWDNDMNRLTLCVSTGGIDTMKNMLGIKTEIDFRQNHSDEENFPDGKTTSILGSGVNYYHCPMVATDFLTKDINKTAIKNIFEIFADASNYPITYHCAVGADRTGAITYLLNGLLGVSKENLTRDYLITNFSYQSKYRAPISDSYVYTLDTYTGSTLQEKIYNYLHNVIGVSTSDLDFIINYLTE